MKRASGRTRKKILQPVESLSHKFLHNFQRTDHCVQVLSCSSHLKGKLNSEMQVFHYCNLTVQDQVWRLDLPLPSLVKGKYGREGLYRKMQMTA